MATDTTRNRVDVTDGRAVIRAMIRRVITMGIGGAMALIGFQQVTVSPQWPQVVARDVGDCWHGREHPGGRAQ